MDNGLDFRKYINTTVKSIWRNTQLNDADAKFNLKILMHTVHHTWLATPVMVTPLQDSEERSEGPDAQCNGNKVYYKTQNTRHETIKREK